MTDVERLLAYEEIRQLACRYALFMDSRDVDALVELFVPDVRVGRDGVGREALAADFRRQLRQVGTTILFVGNHVIDLQETQDASGVVYCRGEIEVGERWIRQAIQYQDTYQRRDGHWRFVRRRHLLWYGLDEAENPMELAPANWPANHTGKGTLPESQASWRDFWSAEPDSVD
jgi:hypothetical protein